MTELPQETRTVPEVPSFLRGVRSLLLAVLDVDGTLLDANEGFRALLAGAQQPPPSQMHALFLNPRLSDLLARESSGGGVVYSGLITLDHGDEEPESWQTHLYRHDGFLLLVGERDIDQDRLLQRRLLALMDDYAETERELARANRELERLSLTDSLTGLPNRRHFDRLLDHEIRRAGRYDDPLSLLLVDIDRFKALNDAHGHQYGDQVLREVAVCIRAHLRESDVVARWGGEEFGVLAPGTDGDGALLLGERLREAVQNRASGGAENALTVSVGVAVHRPGQTAEELLRRADDAVYRAKEAGRNRVVPAPD